MQIIKGRNVPLKSDSALQIFTEELDPTQMDQTSNHIVNDTLVKLMDEDRIEPGLEFAI